MWEGIRILDGQSRYNIFSNWQKALSDEFRRIGIPSAVVPATDPYAGLRSQRAVTLGFNLVRYWAVENTDRHHFAWTVDHPVFLANFFLSRFSRMPVNPERCVIGSVDFKWAQFAREVFGFPHVHFLPHATVLDTPVAPDWKDRPMDIVFFGSMEHPDHYRQELKATAEQFSIPCWPLLERILEDFSYTHDTTLDMTVWSLLQHLGLPHDTALIFMNAFFPNLDSYHRDLSRLRTLASIRSHTVHLFGMGPWNQLNLPANIVVHDPIPHSEVLNVMKQARILLNHTPSHSGGLHERILDALASGCHVLTTPSDYVSAEFPAGAGVSVYRPDESAGLDDMFDHILSESAAPAGVVAAQQIVARRHTMAARALRIRDILQDRWPDLFESDKPAHTHLRENAILTTEGRVPA